MPEGFVYILVSSPDIVLTTRFPNFSNTCATPKMSSAADYDCCPALHAPHSLRLEHFPKKALDGYTADNVRTFWSKLHWPERRR